MDERDPLAELEELTRSLPSITETVMAGVREYLSPDGSVMSGVRVYRDPHDKIAVQRTFCPAGSYLEQHQHDRSVEILVVYVGLLKIKYPDGRKRDLGPGDCVRFEVGAPHEAHAVENTWLIGLTIPADEGFP